MLDSLLDSILKKLFIKNNNQHNDDKLESITHIGMYKIYINISSKNLKKSLILYLTEN